MVGGERTLLKKNYPRKSVVKMRKSFLEKLCSRKRVVGWGREDIAPGGNFWPDLLLESAHTDQREKSNLGRASLFLFYPPPIFSPPRENFTWKGRVSELSAPLFVLSPDPDLMPPTQDLLELGLN